MPKLTDDELADLLRETFAGKEALVNSLPEATKRRSAGPVLLAAAAVLAVLAGVLYGVHRLDTRGDTGPAATPAVQGGSFDAELWATTIRTITDDVRPSAGWTKVMIMDTSDVGKDHVRKGPPLSDVQRKFLAEKLYGIAPVEFHDEDLSPAVVTCRDRRVAMTYVGAVTGKGDQREVQAYLYYDCAKFVSATVRLEKTAAGWVAAATIK